MIRSRLVNWLVTSRLLCWLGLHMPVMTVRITDEGQLVRGPRECAVCERLLPRRLSGRAAVVPLDDLAPGDRYR